jgi:glycogen debranching enzyme
LTLLAGRYEEARGILQTFSRLIRDGLIPNFFSEHEGRGLYNTADATLWFFHALDRSVELTGDRDTLRELLPKLIDVVEHHRRDTRFGIGVDPQDGLLRQGGMDAKVGDWVATPRRGKAVEINALWYNVLQLMAQWVEELQYTGEAPPFSPMAMSARIISPSGYSNGSFAASRSPGQTASTRMRCLASSSAAIFARSLAPPQRIGITDCQTPPYVDRPREPCFKL